MKTCAQCGLENTDESLVCTGCGSLLSVLTIDNGNTRLLQQDIQRTPLRQWGTSRLGNERLLALHIRGYDEPLEVHLNTSLSIGRLNTTTGETPDIDLEQYDAQEMGVSRNHATILIEDDAVKIKDTGSANSTYLNGQKLIAHQTRILRDGDELRLGKLVIHITFG